jgi:rhodanese-related sulfurtransferase/DNA-binding transcriptional ArsR family regulator
MPDAAHRRFKDALYGQFARLGKALSSPWRLEFLDLLAQSERTVDSLATETGLSLANASQHLQTLRQAGLVESRKHGLFVYYRLSDTSVSDLSASIRTVAERRLAELDRLVRAYFGSRSDPEPVEMGELLKRARVGDIVILDARPTNEYAAGHIAGAVSAPIDELQRRLRSLPKDKEYVAYCRGPYCVYADRAVEVLRASGRRARRLVDGFPEWQSAGLPIARGVDATHLTGNRRTSASTHSRKSVTRGKSLHRVS